MLLSAEQLVVLYAVSGRRGREDAGVTNTSENKHRPVGESSAVL
jgi:hypothetical protein